MPEVSQRWIEEEAFAELPSYQKEFIEWLTGFKNTKRIREMILHYRYSENEIATMRAKYEKWLDPKEHTRKSGRTSH